MSEWTVDNMVEVKLSQPDDFLKIRETLSRIGIASKKDKKLYQSCHILHKQVDILSCILKNYLDLMVNKQTFQKKTKVVEIRL